MQQQNHIATCIIFLLISLQAFSQHKQDYDLKLYQGKDLSNADYKERFLWGDEENGIILRQYSLPEKNSLVFFEGLYKGKPDGVILMKEIEDGFLTLKIIDVEGLEDGEFNYVQSRGSSNILSIQKEVFGKNQSLSLTFLTEGLFKENNFSDYYTPKSLIQTYFTDASGKNFDLEKCNDCPPKAKYEVTSTFEGIMFDERGNGYYKPLIGIRQNEDGDILYGLSHEDESTTLNLTIQSTRTITIGMTTDYGLPFNSYISIDQFGKIFFIHEEYVLFLTDYNEVEIGSYLDKTYPLGR